MTTYFFRCFYIKNKKIVFFRLKTSTLMLLPAEPFERTKNSFFSSWHNTITYKYYYIKNSALYFIRYIKKVMKTDFKHRYLFQRKIFPKFVLNSDVLRFAPRNFERFFSKQDFFNLCTL